MYKMSQVFKVASWTYLDIYSLETKVKRPLNV